MLWALDEIANVAPIKNLPSIVADSGCRGLQLMACFQDLTQASVRWGKAAEGFLTLFGTKLVFPGIGDRQTLEALSMMVGDWDRPYVVSGTSEGQSVRVGPFPHRVSNSGSSAMYSTRREVLLSPGEIANIPQGHALLVRSGRWGLVEHTPYFQSLPWTAVIAQSPDKVLDRGGPDVLVPDPLPAQDMPQPDVFVLEPLSPRAPADTVTAPVDTLTTPTSEVDDLR
jgi:type IV secretory pathway TraG/TraD family ATPase VirD4